MPSLSRVCRSIADRIVLIIITGAGSGMGRATAQLFDDEAARIALTELEVSAGERVAAAERGADEIRSAGGGAMGFALDVSDPERIQTEASAIPTGVGEIDILTHNAGVVIGIPIESPEDDDAAIWARSIASAPGRSSRA